MRVIKRDGYELLLGDNPIELFSYFGVDDMHGLSLIEAQAYPATKDSAYIAGLCNFNPNNNERFIYLNTSRWSYGLVFHEVMHHSFFKYDYDINREEEMIAWAEMEANDIIKTFNTKEK